MTTLTPPMPYSCGKQRIAPKIAALFPPHAGYIEPYAGALSVLLAKPPSTIEVVNDIDGDIVTFWRGLRDRPHELELACALTPHSRLETQLSANRDNVTDLERARRVWVALTQHRAAVLRSTAGWRYTHSTNGMSLAAYLDGYVRRIAPAAERLKRASLECRPALEIIKAYGTNADNLLYIDPPYMAETRPQSRGQYTHEMLTTEEHMELLEAVTSCAARVAISGYTNSLYDQKLSDWERHKFPTTSAMGSPRIEIVWTNYTIQPSLID